MKKLTLLVLLATLTVFVACNKDDDPKTGLKLDGELYADFSGYYDDYGTYYYGPPLREDGITYTHRRFQILLTDGEFVGESCWPDEYSYYLNIAFYSPSLDEEMQNGEYEFSLNWTEGDRTGESFGDIYGYFEDTEYYSYSAANGTITVSGTFPNITAKVDLDIYYYDNTPVRAEGNPEDYVTLTGTFKGTLVYECIGD